MINIRDEKVSAIKELRDFCFKTFGVIPGIGECKSFVEYLIVQLPKPVTIPSGEITRLHRALQELNYASLNDSQKEVFANLHNLLTFNK